MNIYGELVRGQLETWAADPSSGVTGRIGRNSVEGRLKWDNGSAYRAILTNDGSCVIGNHATANTNVRFHRGGVGIFQVVLGGDATAEGSLSTNNASLHAKLYQSFLNDYLECTGIATPTNPAAGAFRLYFKSDGLLYSLTPAGVETTVATTSVIPDYSPQIANVSLTCTVGASALTIALKTKAGNDPSAGDPVKIGFRNATAATGDYSILTITAATNLVISSGSTVGTTNSIPFRLWIVCFNDAGTPRLGAINCVSGTSIYPLRDGLASSTAEGGAGAADSAQVIYTGTAVTTKSMRILGYIEYAAGLATVGTYASTPTIVQLLTYGMSLPGQIVQTAGNSTGATASGATALPLDDTIPQITEGDQYLTQAITPVSTANILAIESQLVASNSNASLQVGMALFQDATANALSACNETVDSADNFIILHILHRMLASTVSATTMRIRAGGGAGTTRINGRSGARIYGGVMNSYLNVTEYQG